MESLCRNINIHIFSNNYDQINSYIDEIINQDINNIDKQQLINIHYTIFFCYNCIGILKIIKNDFTIENIDCKIKKFFDNLYNNEKIVNLIKHDTDEKFINFKNNIIKKCVNINANIKLHIDKIHDILNNCDYVDDDISLKYFKKKQVHLNKKTYQHLIRNIQDVKIKKSITQQYCKKSEKSLLLFEEFIVLMRENTNINVYNPTKLINKIIADINKMAYDEIINCKKNNDKIEMFDIYKKYYKIDLNIDNVLKVFIEIINEYFNIELTNCEYEYLWNKNVKTFVASYNEQNIGYIHIDFNHNI